MLWQSIQTIYQNYQEQMGSFRKLFNARSESMRVLARHLEGKSLATHLTIRERYQLITYFVENARASAVLPPENLSYQIWQRVAQECAGTESTLRVCQYFFTQRCWSEQLLDKVMSHDKSDDIIMDLQKIIDALPQEKISSDLMSLSQQEITVEDFLGRCLLQIPDIKRTLCWYRIAIENGQPLLMDIFTRSALFQAALLGILRYYEGSVTKEAAALKFAQASQQLRGRLVEETTSQFHAVVLPALKELNEEDSTWTGIHVPLSDPAETAFQCYLRGYDLEKKIIPDA